MMSSNMAEVDLLAPKERSCWMFLDEYKT